MGLVFIGCDSFLEEKSDGTLVVPGTLADLQALLDNPTYRNNSYCASGEVSADDYVLTREVYHSLAEDLRRMHTWQPDYIFAPTGNNDWLVTYQGIYHCSSVLQFLEGIPRTPANQQTWDNVKGQALALRAFRYLEGVSLWGVAYDEGSANAELGIPLRTNPDFNEPTVRATLSETYQRILADAKLAASLLPITNINAARPTKAMAYGLLARTYLYMRDYPMAGLYADSCLQLQHRLINYSELDSMATLPFPWPLNDEIIFLAIAAPNTMIMNQARVAGEWYERYADGDLRKQIFFAHEPDGTISFKGHYSGTRVMFSGLAVDEMYLTKAECLVRQGMPGEGMDVLNAMLATRWKPGEYKPLTAENPQGALETVLTERRKELIRRGLRWQDIKRLNQEGAEIVLERVYGDEIFRLPPNDPRYALAIPDDIIRLSGISQNPR